MRNAVTRNDGACPVFSLPAVYKNRPGGRIVEQRKRLLDIRIGRKSAPFHRKMNVPHTQRLNDFPFGIGSLFWTPKIQNCPHTELSKAFETCLRWLCASIHMVVHLMEIGNSGS